MKETENLLASKPMLTAVTQGAAVTFVEFFAGSAEISELAKLKGMNTFTIDWVQYGKIDLVKDVEKVQLRDIPFFPAPNIVHISPDCKTYSISAISTHRHKDTLEPKSEYAIKCDRTNQYMIHLLNQWLILNPRMIFFIENPRGALRKMPWMKNFTRHTVWYCQYGKDEERAKPTDIWTNCINWIPRPECHNYKYDSDGNIINRHCHHESARRGAKTGTQGRKGSYERSRIPTELINEMLDSAIRSVAVEAVAP